MSKHDGHPLNFALPKHPEHIPQQMREAKRWLLCDKDKVPRYATGKMRGTTDTAEDLAQLVTFEVAMLSATESGGRFILGFALGADGTGNHWQGIDLDDIPENRLSDIANALPGYVEFSLSGNGCHAYGYGQPFNTLGSNSSGIESYSQGRYFVVTGDKIGDRGEITCLADYVVACLVPRHVRTRSNIADAIVDHSAEIGWLPHITITELRSALFHMRSDDYQLWIDMGLALRELDDTGRGLWLAWGATSTKFDAADASKKWNGFHPSTTGYKAVFAEAQRQGWLNPNSNAARTTKAAIQSNDDDSHRTVITRCGADITPLAISWLWEGWLPAGKLTILAGTAGTGKTTLALGLASTLTSGGKWPDEKHCYQCGNVLIWSSEDNPDDTLVPRLIAASADMRRCHFIEGITQNGESVPFDPSKDIPELNKAVKGIGGVSLLIIDPIVSAVSGDMHRANDVRRSLQALVDFASQHECAVIGITHFAKGGARGAPQDRVIGSQAFGALARMVLVAAKEEGGGHSVLARAKSNIAPDDGGIEYHVEVNKIAGGIEATHVVWDGVIEGTAREILGDVEHDDSVDESPQDDLKGMLKSTLANSGGRMYVNDLQAQIKNAGYSWDSAKRLKKQLGIISEKDNDGMKGRWIWRLSVTIA